MTESRFQRRPKKKGIPAQLQNEKNVHFAREIKVGRASANSPVMRNLSTSTRTEK